MLFRLSLRIFIIGLLVLSSFWVAATFLPVLYSVLFPPHDIQGIVRALEGKGGAPPGPATTVVEEIRALAGPLRRAWQVGYHSEVSATFQVNNSHTSRTTQASYIAWFQKNPKPILLLVERTETDGVLQGYRINQGAPLSLVGSFAYPLVLFAFSLVLFLKRKSAIFVDT
jgi:hypothetical protein